MRVWRACAPAGSACPYVGMPASQSDARQHFSVSAVKSVHGGRRVRGIGGVYLGWLGCGGTPHCRAWLPAKLLCYQGNMLQPGIRGEQPNFNRFWPFFCSLRPATCSSNRLRHTHPYTHRHCQHFFLRLIRWQGIKIEDMKGTTWHFYASAISIAVCLQITLEQSHPHDRHDWHKQHKDKTSSKSADGDNVNTGRCSAFQAGWQTNIWRSHTICTWAATAQHRLIS